MPVLPIGTATAPGTQVDGGRAESSSAGERVARRSQRLLVVEALPWLEAVSALLTLVALACAAVGFESGDTKSVVVFGGMAVVLSPLSVRIRHERSKMSFRSERALAIMALTWVFAAMVSTLPLWILSTWSASTSSLRPYASFPHALFEGVSAMTSTGLTVIPHPSQLPASVHLWRSLLQWSGGLGIVAAVAPYLRRHSWRLFSGELGMSDDEPESTKLLTVILVLYLLLTVCCWVALQGLGVPAWEAVNHALCAAATGGFTVTDESLSGYAGGPLLVIGLTELISGSSLPVLAHLVRTKDRIEWSRPRHLQVVPYALAAGIGVAVVVWGPFPESEERMRVAFNWVSAVSTSGFSAVPMTRVSTFFSWCTIVAMLWGACHESTGGGLKHSRLMLLVRRTMRAVRQRELRPVEREAVVLTVIWMLLLAVAAPLLAEMEGIPIREALFESTSALGGVGLSMGVSSSGSNGPSMLILASLMMLGRLEVFALLALLTQPLPLHLPDFLVAQKDE